MTDTTDIDRAAEIAALGLTITAVFVPFSQSRNKAEKPPSLNWRVTVQRNGRDVLTCDYSAGCGHCPAKATKAPATYRGKDRFQPNGKPYPGTTSAYRRPTEAEKLSDYLADWRAAECESGFAMEYDPLAGNADFKPRRVRTLGEHLSHKLPILPSTLDVLYSLQCDARVLDYATFEEWASEYGYDSDSRNGEAAYRACLEIGLKLRAALGEIGLAKLSAIFEDY